MTPEEIAYKSLQRLYKKRKKIDEEIDQAVNLLKTICRHLNRVEKEEYIEGVYLNVSEYYKYSVCTLCNHKVLLKSTPGSHV